MRFRERQYNPVVRFATSRLGGGSSAARGSGLIGGAQIANGLLTYAFLTLPARTGSLDAVTYGVFTSVWFAVFTVGTGMMIPLEQELTRRTVESLHSVSNAGIARSVEPARHWLRVAARAAMAFVAPFTLIVLVLSDGVSELFFGGDRTSVWAVLVAIAVFAGSSLVRGWAAGVGRFGLYAVLVIVDSSARLIIVVVLVGALSESRPGPYGFALAGGLLLSALLGFFLIGGSWPAPPSGLTRLFTRDWLALSGSQLLAQMVMNGPVLLAPLLVDDTNRDAVGRIGAALVLVRAPLILFPALAATLLPHLTRMAVDGNRSGLRSTLNRVGLPLAALSIVAPLAAAAVGPLMMRILFGPDFELSRLPLAALTAGSMLFLWASVESLGLLASGRRTTITVSWGGAVLVGVLASLRGGDPATRVGVAFVAAALAALLLQRFLPERSPRAA